APETLIHPKFVVLKELLLNEIEKKPNSRILVFVKLRASVRNIVGKLKKVDSNLNAVRFVGQANKSKKDKGLSQKKQIEILDKFKQGKYNILVSTNVGEEGLDVAECDLVIFYDVVASEIRLIQRKGRTARHRKGMVIILYCKDTQDEIYLNIALNKLKRMNYNLKYKNSSNHYQKQIVSKKNMQSNLIGFSQDQTIEKSSKNKDIILNINLDMRYGLRRKLNENNIAFSVDQINHSIELFGKVIIYIQNANNMKIEKLKNYSSYSSKYELVLIAIDFLNYEERIEGEKRLFKKKISEFGKTYPFQIVFIDNAEELFFIIQSIYESEKKRKEKS
ncbi:MAG: helicase-related protein, partial [Candidatus Lokiarchaeota archaeon]